MSANATDLPTPEPLYVLAAWNINTPDYQDGGDVWGGGGQTLAATLPTDSTDLSQLGGTLPCGGWYQIDLYDNNDITESLLSGGVLYGPSNPPESAASGASPWYKIWYSGDCAQEPEDKLFEDAGETFTCEAWTYWTKKGFYEKSFDPVANVWTFADEPTITEETSQNYATNYDERYARGCEPELAETGVNDYTPWILGGGIVLFAVGLVLTYYGRPFRR
jgi:hypothetical protein